MKFSPITPALLGFTLKGFTLKGEIYRRCASGVLEFVHLEVFNRALENAGQKKRGCGEEQCDNDECGIQD